MEKFIIKETEKAIYIEMRFENIVLDSERTFKTWIPKSCIIQEDKKIQIKPWFMVKKIEELFGHNASTVNFNGLVIQN